MDKQMEIVGDVIIVDGEEFYVKEGMEKVVLILQSIGYQPPKQNKEFIIENENTSIEEFFVGNIKIDITNDEYTYRIGEEQSSCSKSRQRFTNLLEKNGFKKTLSEKQKIGKILHFINGERHVSENQKNIDALLQFIYEQQKTKTS